MNVYDFDRTIYNGDCSVDFYIIAKNAFWVHDNTITKWKKL
jgi:hypothetical protein